MPNSLNTVSFVVPVYNSAGSLSLLVDAIEQHAKEFTSEFELILVNDGSIDASWSVIESLAHRHPWIRGINLARNYGQHNAVLCGLRQARYEITVTMDGHLPASS